MDNNKTPSLERMLESKNDVFSTKMTSAEKRLHKIEKNRQMRKAAQKTKDFFEIEVDLEAGSSDCILQEKFQEQYESLLQTKSSPIECYHTILNSLDYYFTKSYGSSNSNTQELVNNYIKKIFRKKCNVWSAEDKLDPKDKLECELLCFIEMHLLKHFPIPLNQTQIVRKLRTLYFASDPLTFKQFADESLCDEFVEDLPFFLAGIYEELQLDMPLDLQSYQSQEQLAVNGPALAVEKEPAFEKRSNKMASKLDKFFKDEEEEAERSASASAGKSSKKKKKPMAKVLRRNGRNKSTAFKSPSKGNNQQKMKRLQQVVQNTPFIKQEQQEEQKRKLDMENEVIVEQTPIGKIRQNGHSREALKLTKLLKEQEVLYGLVSPEQLPPSADPDIPSTSRATVFTQSNTTTRMTITASTRSRAVADAPAASKKPLSSVPMNTRQSSSQVVSRKRPPTPSSVASRQSISCVKRRLRFPSSISSASTTSAPFPFATQ